MKLSHFLHLLDPYRLSGFLQNNGGFPGRFGEFSALDLANMILKREITEAEVVTNGTNSAFIFWSSSRLIMEQRTIDQSLFNSGILVLSAYRDSAFALDPRVRSVATRIHPFAFNPEWIECFVFSIKE